MDIAAISTILSSVKTATEIAKFLKDSDLTLEKAETKLKLAELIVALADVKTEVAGLQGLLLDKDEEIRKLQEELRVKGKVIYEAPFYWLVSDEGQKAGPFCQACFDNNQKLIRLQLIGGQSRWECKVCKMRFHDRSHSLPQPPNPNVDRGGGWMAS